MGHQGHKRTWKETEKGYLQNRYQEVQLPTTMRRGGNGLEKGIVHARTVHEFMAKLNTYRYGDGTAQAKLFIYMLQLGKYKMAEATTGRHKQSCLLL